LSQLCQLLNEGAAYIEGGPDLSIKARKQRYVIVLIYALLNTLDGQDRIDFKESILSSFGINPVSFDTEISKIENARKSHYPKHIISQDTIDLLRDMESHLGGKAGALE